MMATIFLSYSLQDEELARQLEARLKRKGHSFRIDVGTPPAGKWRENLMKALRKSDVLIPILSHSGLGSNYVASEIGSARVFGETKGMLLLPVVVGTPFMVPSFVSDHHCFRLPLDESKSATDEKELDRLADELDKAVQEHVAKPPRIFVSHRHKDEAVVRALVNLLESAFQIEKEDVRCTSVQPYTLSPGDRTSERLRAEIRGAEVVLGLLSPDTAESKYVIAELGASWGADVPTFPLLVRGATFDDVPEPLSERHSVSLEKVENCTQLVDEIARVTSFTRKKDVTARVVEQASKLAKLSRAGVSGSAKAGSSSGPPNKRLRQRPLSRRR
jgi:TIR domain